jgi:hypothetical protein
MQVKRATIACDKLPSTNPHNILSIARSNGGKNTTTGLKDSQSMVKLRGYADAAFAIHLNKWFRQTQYTK